MPSKKTLTPLIGGCYYHIFNRGINRQPLFFSEDNYQYFLQLLGQFLPDCMDILAYVLIPNHFHMVVRIKEEIYLDEDGNLTREPFPDEAPDKEPFPNFKKVSDDIQIGRHTSNQLKRLFIVYAMAINKQENRVGGLFDAKFKRLEINDQEYLEYLIFYAHNNPVHHGICENFKEYKHSSYKALTSYSYTQVNRKMVMDIFGGRDHFIHYHNAIHDEQDELTME